MSISHYFIHLPYHSDRYCCARDRGPIRVPISIHFSVASPAAPDLLILFGPILDILSLGSFVSAWIATAALLRQYRQRIGKLKYWSLIVAPLVYFLFPFGTYFINLSCELMANSPVLFSIIYVSTFSATKQVGGILFSMVFLTAATLVNRTELRRYLVISAIGISILFGCIGANSLLYAVYPPFGLITISFMPIGGLFAIQWNLRICKTSFCGFGAPKNTSQKCRKSVISVKDNWNNSDGRGAFQKV